VNHYVLPKKDISFMGCLADGLFISTQPVALSALTIINVVARVHSAQSSLVVTHPRTNEIDVA